MENSMSRILVEAVVKKALKDIKDSPERETRNLVDMALQFADGRFQQNFFKTAQTMLKNENSAYYDLLRDVLAHVDTDRLFAFGMNLGYNSCTLGARRIREREEALGCRIPWAIALQMRSDPYFSREQTYHAVIQEGEQLGIYAWMLFADDLPLEAPGLMEAHPDSAFFLFCKPADVTPAFVDYASHLHHLMLVVRSGEGVENACALLRESELLYSVYYPYCQKDTEAILNGDLFRDAQQLSPILTILLAEPDCPDAAQRLVHQAVQQARNGQKYQTIPWELHGDNRLVDEIISDDVCSIYFDREGRLCEWTGPIDGGGNLFRDRLTDILKGSYPRSPEQVVS